MILVQEQGTWKWKKNRKRFDIEELKSSKKQASKALEAPVELKTDVEKGRWNTPSSVIHPKIPLDGF